MFFLKKVPYEKIAGQLFIDDDQGSRKKNVCNKSRDTISLKV